MLHNIPFKKLYVFWASINQNIYQL